MNNCTNIPIFRTKRDREIAFEKWRNGTGKIVLLHIHKAGGTTVRNYFKLMAKIDYKNLLFFSKKKKKRELQKFFIGKNIWSMDEKNDETLQVIESFTYIHRFGYSFDLLKMISKNPHHIYVMTMREPISRILSQYQFEWRWGGQRGSPFAPYDIGLEYNELKKYFESHPKELIDMEYSKWSEKYAHYSMENLIEMIEK
ncbi:hypothetical protein RFI_32398, partial [Reticulomyxa filosa]